jgi:hypothetical protein
LKKGFLQLFQKNLQELKIENEAKKFRQKI